MSRVQLSVVRPHRRKVGRESLEPSAFTGLQRMDVTGGMPCANLEFWLSRRDGGSPESRLTLLL
ncbi:MAG: hypothetical protein M2R45_04758 [Verrucomicrobia subdivision 3 bacterium]|nr:hypothetical protein [Limisphaerales bacterium]MCS1415087.1 hypothetical protein [Limisphaerales bacterium]